MKPYYSESGIEIYHGDCLEIMPQLPAVDFVITDPPYNAKKNYGGMTDDARPWPEWVGWLDLVLDNCRWNAPDVFMFLSQTSYRKYVRLGRHEIKWSAIWHKPLAMAMCVGPYMPHWEHIAYWGPFRNIKGNRWGSDVISANVEHGKTRFGHPTPKPYLLMTKLIQRVDAQTILDPFMGSGTTLRAAKDLGRKAIGIEINEEYCETAAKRLGQSVMDFGPRVERRS